MNSNRIDRFLGRDDVEEYIGDDEGVDSVSDMEIIYNDYYNGNITDFKSHFTNSKILAQFLTYIIEMGTDVREIQKMLKVLS